MPPREIPLVNNNVYHIVNRGVAPNNIFNTPREYRRFLELIKFYSCFPSTRFSHFDRLNDQRKSQFNNRLQNNEEKLQVLAFALTSNHFHLVLRQLADDAITDFMTKLENSHVRYYNLLNGRKGPLFESRFLVRRIEDDDKLLHVVRYVNLNPVSHGIIAKEELPNYPWSSFSAYIGRRDYQFVKTDFILDFFKDNRAYYDFVMDQADYQRQLDVIKHLVEKSLR